MNVKDEREERVAQLSAWIDDRRGILTSKGNKLEFARSEVWHLWRFVSEEYGAFTPKLQEFVYKEMKEMVDAAATSDAAFTASKMMAARYISAGKQMPEFLAVFAIQFLMDTFKPPRPAPAPAHMMFPRDTAIWQLVEQSLKAGSPTKEQAYDEVAEALLRAGARKNNPDTVKKTYLKFRRDMKIK